MYICFFNLFGKYVEKIDNVAFGKNKISEFTIESGNSYLYTDGVGIYTTTSFVASLSIGQEAQ